jgi:MFS family permease
MWLLRQPELQVDVSTKRRSGSPDATPASTNLSGTRRHLTITIFGGVGLGATAVYAASTVAPLVAVDITGSQALSGLPVAMSITGTAVGALLLSRVMARHGRRRGLVLGYGAAVGGALLAVLATAQSNFALLLAALLAIGCGNSAIQLARYAAADAHPARHRTVVIGWVVWAATIGAVAGPMLGTYAASRFADPALPSLAGAFLVTALAFALGALAFFILLRPDPGALRDPFDELELDTTQGHTTGTGWSPVHLALAGLVVSQCVMVLIMVMSPVHLRQHGGAVPAIGMMMSSHTLGMFAFTPLTGHLAQRFGNVPVLTAGLMLLAAAGIAGAMAPAGNATALGAALFVLGLGWSCSFVAASGLLARGAVLAERTRRQGTADTIVFGAAALASLASGVLLSLVGYTGLCLIGSALAGAAAVVVHVHGFVVVRRTRYTLP